MGPQPSLKSTKLPPTLGKSGSSQDFKGRSVAVQYEVRLQEILAGAEPLEDSSKPDPKRLACHMAVLRELLKASAFGPLQSLMEKVVGEVVKCLYTDKLASSPLPPALREPGPEAALERVPFFVENDHLAQSLGEALEQARGNSAKARESKSVADDALRRLHGEGPESEKAAATIGLLEYDVNKQKALVEMLRQESAQAAEAHQSDLLALEGEVRRWKRTLDEAHAELAALKQERRDQEGVRMAFAQLQTQQSAAVNKSEDEASKLEGQLMVLQNARIDEYEAALERASSQATQSMLRHTFVEELSQLQNELSALRSHMHHARPKDASSDPPDIKLGSILPHGERPKPDMLLRPAEYLAKVEGGGAGEGSGLGAVLDRLVGPLWDGFRHACAGKLHDLESVLMRPRSVPQAGLIRTLEDLLTSKWSIEQKVAALRMAKAQGAVRGESAGEYRQSLSRGALKVGEGKEGGAEGPGHGEGAGSGAGPGGGMRSEEEQLLMMSLGEYFYEYLRQKYMLQPTVLLVAHGLLSAMERTRTSNSVVMLVSRVLSGEMDEATWRYTMHWRRLLKALPLASTRDFSVFVAMLYPAAREEELQDLCLGYATHTTDPASKSSALEFLVGRLLAKQEPRLRKWLKILKWKDTQHRNSFRRGEFLEIGSKLFPNIPREVVGEEFTLASQRYGGERVPLEALAYVACCLDAMSVEVPPPEGGVEGAPKLKEQSPDYSFHNNLV